MFMFFFVLFFSVVYIYNVSRLQEKERDKKWLGLSSHGGAGPQAGLLVGLLMAKQQNSNHLRVRD